MMAPPAPSAVIATRFCTSVVVQTATPPLVHCGAPVQSTRCAKTSRLPLRLSLQVTMAPPAPSEATTGTVWLFAAVQSARLRFGSEGQAAEAGPGSATMPKAATPTAIARNLADATKHLPTTRVNSGETDCASASQDSSRLWIASQQLRLGAGSTL